MTSPDKIAFIERHFPLVVSWFRELQGQGIDFNVIEAEGSLASREYSLLITVEWTEINNQIRETRSFVGTREERQLAAGFNCLGFPHQSEKRFNRPKACVGCVFYHGKGKLICAVHPSGVEEDTCPDWSNAN